MAYVGTFKWSGKCDFEAFRKIAETLQRPVRRYLEHFYDNAQESRESFSTDNHEYVCNNCTLWIRPLSSNLDS